MTVNHGTIVVVYSIILMQEPEWTPQQPAYSFDIDLNQSVKPSYVVQPHNQNGFVIPLN